MFSSFWFLEVTFEMLILEAEEGKEIFGIQNGMEWFGMVVTHPFPLIFIAIEFAVLCSLGC